MWLKVATSEVTSAEKFVECASRQVRVRVYVHVRVRVQMREV